MRNWLGLIVVVCVVGHAAPVLAEESAAPSVDDESAPQMPTVSVIDLPVIELPAVEVPLPEVTDIEIPVEEVITEDAGEPQVSSQPFMVIGGTRSPAWSERAGGARRRNVGRYGGSRASEYAVEAGLRWLVRHQHPAGYWDGDGYHQLCQPGMAPCVPSAASPGGDLETTGGDLATTAWAMLAVMGAGYDHQSPNKHRRVMQAAMAWLLPQQGDAGQFGSIETHALVTLALVEAYGLSDDQSLAEPCQRALDWLQAQGRRTDTGQFLGWATTDDEHAAIDWLTTARCFSAVYTASFVGLDVRDPRGDLADSLHDSWWETNVPRGPGSAALGSSRFPLQWSPTDHSIMLGSGEGTGVGLWLTMHNRSSGDHAQLTSLTDWLLAHRLPTTWPEQPEYLLYDTQAMFHRGGNAWRSWNQVTRDLVVNAAIAGDTCRAGSWLPAHGPAESLVDGGQIVETAIGVMILQVYYHSRPQHAATPPSPAAP